MVDEDFSSLIELLESKGVRWKVVSLGATGHLKEVCGIGADSICELKCQSKANSQTFLSLANSLMTAPEECMLIDDGILAVRAAKLVGMHTVFMQNDFFGTELDYQLYAHFVDHRIFNLKKLGHYISQRL